MVGAAERSRIRFTGAPREARGAVLVLEGGRRAELRRACALAGELARRCLLVAVDGGLGTCRAEGLSPDVFVGDLDSADRAPRGVPSVVFPRDKDFSDLGGALREVRSRGISVVVVAGLLGGRLDHEWANLLEIGARARWFSGFLIPTGRGMVVVTARGCRAVTVRGRPFSLFALGGGATVTLAGAKWALGRSRVRPGALGLSNVTGSSLRLRVHSGAALLVFPS